MICIVCKQRMTVFDVRRLYCSQKCELEAANKRMKAEQLKPSYCSIGLPAVVVGRISEHLVVADLLGRGYEVFHACSPGSTCDMIVMRQDKGILRVEVKTGYLSQSGDLVCNSPRKGASDVLAVVLEGGRVQYNPEL